ncbi:predicted protein [Nematostella vectensis]|uniref:Sperm-tail PG-rich repeat-containing protein 2 n=1 Tax=Nematostella vectensis TaxID=45351 RepID=A7SCZ2_NEMVE|nr:sperm-tail PG-rich repeat-containing protein 2 [Nematostella vectensis]EDO38402.1 predicted protein [Nematostella vectensis]|eukprot:XP_001630465.1 predicted protein [Nematostella vectensis]
MYDRAPRTLTQPLSSTADAVGPGTYDPPEPGRRKYDGYAPFSSMTGRETFLDIQDSVVAAPGPGQYDPQLVQHHISGGHTLANRSSRFTSKPVKTPGPGAYNLQKKGDWLKDGGGRRGEGVGDMGDVALFKTSRVTFKRKPDPPSIPSPGKAYGYEESTDGSLRPQEMPHKDSSMGPAYYQVKHDDDPVTRKYGKGTNFSNRTSKRLQFKGNAGPGPGDYNPYQDPGIKVPMDIIVEESRKQPFESALPRYHQVIVQEEEKKAVPGPGKYEIKSQFEVVPRPTLQDDPVINAPFGTQSKRFFDDRQNNPAPGAYNNPKNALEVLKRTTGLKRSPFGQTSVRFEGKPHHSKKTPGPGAYNITDMTSELLRKAHLESTRKGAFGSTSHRIAPMTRRHEDHLPGPAHYLTTAEKNKKEIQLSSTFQSTTGRLHTPPGVVMDVPPPGSYDVSKSYDSTQGRVMYPYAQSKNRNTKRTGAFNSTASRFSDKRRVPMEETDPGPGHYDAVSSGKPGGLMVTRDTRFKPLKSDVPGPGAYELNPIQAHTVLKGTFNTTLNNPIVPNYEDMEGRTPSKQAFLLGM